MKAEEISDIKDLWEEDEDMGREKLSPELLKHSISHRFKDSLHSVNLAKYFNNAVSTLEEADKNMPLKSKRGHKFNVTSIQLSGICSGSPKASASANVG